MKTKTSDSGVKAANRFEIVCKIESKNYWNTYKIEKILSKELLNFWNYKAEGLTLEIAKKQLLECVMLRKNIADAKLKNVSEKKAGKYNDLLQQKRRSIANFLAICENLELAKEATKYNYGAYQCKHRTFLLTKQAAYPLTMKIKWDEKHDWDFYAKSYKRPKSSYTNRRVVFSTIGKLGKVEEVFIFNLDNFAGNFVEKAIASFYKVKKNNGAKELKSIQLSDYFKIKELKKINGYRIFERYIGPVFWDFAILEVNSKTTYHANNYERLLEGLKNKINTKLEKEFELITKKVGLELGFCEIGMRQFCEENSLDYDSNYSRKDFRNIILKNRMNNCRKYNVELKKLGISLNCK